MASAKPSLTLAESVRRFHESVSVAYLRAMSRPLFVIDLIPELLTTLLAIMNAGGIANELNWIKWIVRCNLIERTTVRIAKNYLLIFSTVVAIEMNHFELIEKKFEKKAKK